MAYCDNAMVADLKAACMPATGVAPCNGAKTQLAHILSCSICMDVFKDPVVVVETGVTYCNACINDWWVSGK